jgi:hypothetical protein
MKLRSLRSVADRSFTVSTEAQHGSAASSRGDSVVSVITLGLLLATLWLATHPYVGADYDSRFYTIQGLSALLPGRFADDLYFHYGSQDQFTTFTLMYKPVLAALGIGNAALVLTIIGQGFWITGLIYLARRLFRNGRIAFGAAVMAVALPGGVIFNYAEPFLTPRLFSQALTLWALGSMLRGRQVTALMLLGLSATVHPLMTLPGLAFLFLHEAAGRRIWWLIGAGVLIASLVLAWWGVQPFARLSETFDPAWFAVVRVRDSFSLVANWSDFDRIRATNMLVLAALGLTIAEPRERHFLVVALAVALGGVAVNWLGGDILRNVLIVDIQQYRATWLLALTANLFVGPLLLRMPKSITSAHTRAALLVAMMLLAMTSLIVPAYVVALSMLIVAGLANAFERVRREPLSPVGRVCFTAICGFLTVMCLIRIADYMQAIRNIRSAVIPTALGLALTAAALGAIAVKMLAPVDMRRMILRPLVIIAAVLTLVAALNWDQRTPWTMFVETTAETPESLSPLLPEHGQIYWEGDVRFPWYVLRRPSYFSCAQGTGALFFRGTALAYQHRYDSFRKLGTIDFRQEATCLPPPGAEVETVSRQALVSVCVSEPELGALVLTHPVPDTPAQIWASPVPFEEIRADGPSLRSFATDRFYIYSCANLR